MVGRYEDALPIARRCVEENPSSSECLRNLAAIQMHLNDVDGAVSNYEGCLAIDPTNALALQGLAWARHRQGATTRAIDLVDEALRLCPTNEIILATRATFLAEEGRFDESLRDLIEAHRLRPGSDYVVNKLFPALLFFSCADESNVQLAAQLLEQDRREFSPSGRRFAQALVDYSAGRFDEAAKGFEDLQQSRNGFSGAWTVTLWRLSELRGSVPDSDHRAKALTSLKQHCDQTRMHGGKSAFDKAVMQHVETFLQNEPSSG